MTNNMITRTIDNLLYWQIIFPYSLCTGYIQQGSQPDNLVMLCKYFCVHTPLKRSIS